MNKKLLKWSILAIALIGLIGMFFIFKYKNNQTHCNKLQIDIVRPKELFVSVKELHEFILLEYPIINKPISEIDLLKVQLACNSHPFVAHSEAFIGLDATLQCNIVLKHPILRVHPNIGKPYYLDKKGVHFPLSKKYTAYVPVAVGNIDTLMDKKLYRFATYVEKKPRFGSILQQIFVEYDGTIGITTSLSNHKIIIGDLENLETKLDKLFQFYKGGLAKKGWNVHNTIDLRYKGQVVCK